MAKRFIDSDIFKKQFMRDLESSYKLLWIYILQDCNHAGIWEVDFEVAQIRTGSKLSKEVALKKFDTRIIEIDNGSKWFIPDFISFQYGQLSEVNLAHKNIILLLKKHLLLSDDLVLKGLERGFKGPPKDLRRGFEAPLDMEMDKVKEKEKEMDKEKEGPPELIFPYQTEDFMKVWAVLIKERKWKRKSHSALQASLKQLSNYSEEDAILMMNSTIAGEWQGLFEPKNSNNGNKTINGGGKKRAWGNLGDHIKQFTEEQTGNLS